MKFMFEILNHSDVRMILISVAVYFFIILAIGLFGKPKRKMIRQRKQYKDEVSC